MALTFRNRREQQQQPERQQRQRMIPSSEVQDRQPTGQRGEANLPDTGVKRIDSNTIEIEGDRFVKGENRKWHYAAPDQQSFGESFSRGRELAGRQPGTQPGEGLFRWRDNMYTTQTAEEVQGQGGDLDQPDTGLGRQEGSPATEGAEAQPVVDYEGMDEVVDFEPGMSLDFSDLDFSGMDSRIGAPGLPAGGNDQGMISQARTRGTQERSVGDSPKENAGRREQTGANMHTTDMQEGEPSPGNLASMSRDRVQSETQPSVEDERYYSLMGPRSRGGLADIDLSGMDSDIGTYPLGDVDTRRERPIRGIDRGSVDNSGTRSSISRDRVQPETSPEGTDSIGDFTFDEVRDVFNELQGQEDYVGTPEYWMDRARDAGNIASTALNVGGYGLAAGAISNPEATKRFMSNYVPGLQGQLTKKQAKAGLRQSWSGNPRLSFRQMLRGGAGMLTGAPEVAAGGARAKLDSELSQMDNQQLMAAFREQQQRSATVMDPVSQAGNREIIKLIQNEIERRDLSSPRGDQSGRSFI